MLKRIISNKDLLLGPFLILSYIAFFANGALNNIYYEVIHYDDGYNGSVSATLMRTGNYEVVYPDHIPFYNKITTGVPVLLPVAYVYQWFGISSFTTQIIPLIYSFVTIIIFWILLSLCLKKKRNKPYALSALATLLLLLADKCYYIISINLWGEIAALLFLLLSLICWFLNYKCQKPMWIALAGAWLAWAFLTKSAMIFIMCSWMGIVIFETYITHSLTKKETAHWILGFFGGFAILDGYKMIKVGGVINYLKWWKAEWHNMLDQSSGFSQPLLSEKFNFLEETLNCNKYIALGLMIAAIFIYLICIVKLYKGKKVDSGFHTLCIGGITGDSLMIYFLLFGKSGLMFSKRLIMNQLALKLFFIFLLCYWALYLWQLISTQIKERKFKLLSWPASQVILFFLSIFVICPPEKIIKNYSTYTYKPTDYTYNQKKMMKFLSEIERLTSDGKLYTYGWYQEPNVTLFLNREMTDITKVINGKEKLESNSYFIVGNMIHHVDRQEIENKLNIKLVKIDEVDLDYEQMHVSSMFGDFAGFDLLSIYQIIPNEIKEECYLIR